MRFKSIFFLTFLFWTQSLFSHGFVGLSDMFYMKVPAKDKYERTALTEKGILIEGVHDGYVLGVGKKEKFIELRPHLSKKNQTLFDTWFQEANTIIPILEQRELGTPSVVSIYRSYDQVLKSISEIARRYPQLIQVESLGKSIENRDIWNMVITDGGDADQKPALVIMGAHHAREVLTVELPLVFAEYIVNEYQNNNPQIRKLLKEHTLYLIPVVNPDGVIYDSSAGKFKHWRKNRRRNSNGTYGVDLNRNYGYKWGGKGSSSRPSSQTYRGATPFSEPETQAMRDFLKSHNNINILLSLHSFSELILYPWGHTHNAIAKKDLFHVHKKMAETMAQWNRYTPQQSSDLYVTSGDTTDWSFGELGIVSFTFELDPKSFRNGGFYPTDKNIVEKVFQKNLKPFLYLWENAKDPYQVLAPTHITYGLETPLVQESQSWYSWNQSYGLEN